MSEDLQDNHISTAQFKRVNDKLDAFSKDLSSMKVTVEGKLEGTIRTPGLVDIVQTYALKMDTITRVLIGIGALLAGEVALNALRQFGLIK